MTRIDGRWLGVFPALTLLVMLVPLLSGLWYTLLPSFGYLPSLGFEQWSLQAWQALFAHPLTLQASGLSVLSGVLSSGLALISALYVLSHCYHRASWRWLQRAFAPMLAVPHVALAIGLVFLLAPSGWVLRSLSPWLTGFSYPPLWQSVQDPYGLSLVLALWLKELPFLLFMLAVAAGQMPLNASLAVGQSLGYSRAQVWWRVIIPQLLPRVRLPMLAVLAFACSVVDVAQVIGPTKPPTLAVLVWQWFSHSDVSFRLMGAAGALWLLALIGSVLLVYLWLERHCLRWSLGWQLNGRRHRPRSDKPAGLLVTAAMLLAGLAMVVMLIWSFAWRWRFPDMLPQTWQLGTWQQAAEFAYSPFSQSLLLALSSALLSLLLCIGCLEYELHSDRARALRWSKLFYLPLLVPQVAFLFGLQVQLLKWQLDGRWLGVIWAHTVFVLPYVFLSLADNYRGFEQRYMQAAVSLNHRPLLSFVQIKLAMLAKPIAVAMAVGFSVSIAQYLPTLFIGAGRFSTLTTEAVALASGGDRRITAVMVILQSLLPLLVFSLAQLTTPKRVFKPFSWTFHVRT
ncbi:ABC transporter permease [Aliagarivorans taiwanensis]|uniref:ABC transporter permease n=1 Tax=Aliagarivorans taiwanensis TaxID=561966 RepID=UPI0004231EE4|nr:hypothetical protein [Aliagarivorans taiwanensis]